MYEKDEQKAENERRKRKTIEKIEELTKDMKSWPKWKREIDLVSDLGVKCQCGGRGNRK